MKKISISIPCRNEEENIELLVKEIENQFKTHLPNYDYEIQFSDNASTDSTRKVLRELCSKNAKIRAIFNIVSFNGSAFNSIINVSGDCCIHMAADFQDPPELIPLLVKSWEKGSKVVCAIKTASKEGNIMWCARSLYYKLIKKMSSIPQIEHFTGFGLYDREFIEIIRSLKDPIPTLRGLVAEYGYSMDRIEFVQPKRERGKSSHNFFSLFNYAMQNITTYTQAGVRLATFGGLIIGAISFIVGVVYFILKLIWWDKFPAGTAPILIGVFFLGAIQLFFIGLLGEYIMTMNKRLLNRPLAIEQERINFSDSQSNKN